MSDKKLVIVLTALLVLAFALGGRAAVEAVKLLPLQFQLAQADADTETIDKVGADAVRAEPSAAARSLDYVVHYYPSGTKRETGSRLDRIVERHRACLVRAIIAHLRAKTGEDLGDDPQPWIDRFAAK